jgi:hypothetical protein
MPSPQKRKGARWERKAVELLEKLVPESSWKKLAGSGAIGTVMKEPLLRGDISGVIPYLGKTFRVEAKVGYGGAKQLTFKREWLEKIREEAEGTYSIPLVVCKFSGARGESKHFVAMDFEAFADLLKQVKTISDSEAELLKRVAELEKDGE